MRDWQKIVLMLAAMGFNTIPRWLENFQWYYKGQAISILLWLLAARAGKNSRIVLIVWDWTILLALCNAIDEMFLNPTLSTTIELATAFVVTIWTIHRFIKCLRTKKLENSF